MSELLDFLAYGPAGVSRRRKKRDSLEQARTLTELQDLVGRAPPQDPLATDAGGFIPDLGRTPDFNARDKLDLSIALEGAGIDEKALADTRDQQARTQTFLDVVKKLTAGDASPEVARTADYSNKLSIAPVHQSGGVATNRFDPVNPIIGQSTAIDALAKQRAAAAEKNRAEAGVTSQRGAALRQVLADPNIAPPVRADIANSKSVYTPQRVKVRAADGTESYMDATPRLSGGFDYTPATDNAGAPLRPSATGEDGGTALQRDTAFIAETLGLTPEKAILWKLNSKVKSPQTLWEEIMLAQVRADPYNRVTPEERTARARSIWSSTRPNEPVPIDQAPDASTAAPAGAPPLAAEGDGEYASPDEVKAAFEAGEIEYEEAVQHLQSMGFE